MRKDIIIAAVIFVALMGSAALKLYFEGQVAEPQVKSSVNGTVPLADEASVAAEISKRIDDISPTSAFADTGWIARRISFIDGQQKAYVEYTDTHIALRLLLEYTFEAGQLKTKVLATFLPSGAEGWNLQFGQDEPVEKKLKHYIYRGEVGQWIPEM